MKPVASKFAELLTLPSNNKGHAVTIYFGGMSSGEQQKTPIPATGKTRRMVWNSPRPVMGESGKGGRDHLGSLASVIGARASGSGSGGVGREVASSSIANLHQLRVTNTELSKHVASLRKRVWEVEKTNKALVNELSGVREQWVAETQAMRASIQAGFMTSALFNLGLSDEERQERDQAPWQMGLDAIRREYESRDERLKAVLVKLQHEHEILGVVGSEPVEAVLKVARALGLIS